MGRPVPNPEVSIHPRAIPLIAGALIAALALPSPAGALQFNTKIDFCLGQEVTAKQVRPFAAKAWRLGAWERGKPPRHVREAHWHHLRCASGSGHRAAIKRRWRHSRAAFYRHRERKLAERRERLALTPYDCGSTRSAIPCYIPACESGYNATARNGSSTAGGYYQIIDSTWYAYGGASNGDSHPAAAAPKAEQDRVAAAIWTDAGPGAWECA